MAIKLIATDLDGTLLNSEHEAPKEFFEWVKRHPEIKTVIASGRQYQALKKMFGGLGEDIIYCGDNGGFIFYRDEMLYSNPIHKTDLYDAIRYLGDIPNTNLVFCGAKSAYMQKTDDKSMEYIRMFFEELRVVDDLTEVVGTDDIVKMSIFEKNGNAASLVECLPNLGKHIECVLSESHWIDIQYITTNKGNAIRFLQKKFDILPEECMAFGDYLNDYFMMKACHFSFAMANAHPEIKEIANFQTTNNDTMGVVSALRVMTE